MSNSALILMSTYQGQSFLVEQLESIRSQTYKDWILLIRDDGSTDGTLEIIKSYCKKDSRILFVKDNLANLKPCQSFSKLMEEAFKIDSPFIFFADQDDYWVNDKLSLQIDLINQLSKKYNESTPILVHSDLKVVNQDLKVIHSSYLAFEKLSANKKNPLRTLLINNYITGCTIGMNRALLKKVTPVPKTAFMHDWWCALCAATFGIIGFIEKPTVYYRQHGANDIGSSGFYSKITHWQRLKKTFQKNQSRFKLLSYQAKDLMNLKIDNHHDLKMINTFSHFSQLNIFSKIYLILIKLKPDGLLRKIGLFFLLFYKANES